MGAMRRAATIVTAALLASGCASPNEGDTAACQAFASAHNALMESIATDASPSTVRALGDAIPDAIEQAATSATSPELTVSLTQLQAQAVAAHHQDDDDAGVAYFLLSSRLFDQCNDIGVDVTETTLEPRDQR